MFARDKSIRPVMSRSAGLQTAGTLGARRLAVLVRDLFAVLMKVCIVLSSVRAAVQNITQYVLWSTGLCGQK